MSHTTASGIECLVSVNGGLVPLSSIQQELFSAGKHLADYPLSAAENIIGYLPGTEDLRHPGKYEIDGICVGEDGSAPLFCLDVNMLTGLRSPGHTELMELLKQCADDKAVIFDLVKSIGLKERMLIAANRDERLERAVEIAYERLSKIVEKLGAEKDKVFSDKTSTKSPYLFMSMGGAGVGKTTVEELAHAHCGDNFVTASLDEFRKKSDLYRVLTAAEHHSDDYVYVEPFANRLRDAVAEHARTHKFNLLYDGTGIPYQPRYSNIIDQFNAAGFYTQIAAVDAFIVKPQGREAELIRSSVIESVKQRFTTTGRALPWVVTVDKHIRAPRSFLNALEHGALNKMSLFANDGERDQHYLVAESFTFSEHDVRALQRHQLAGSLANHLKSLILNRQDSILKLLAHNNVEKTERLLERNPLFADHNVGFQLYPKQHGFKALLIYNTKRMVDFVEKRQLNPNASGEDGLLHKSELLAFHVDPNNSSPWIVRLQGSNV